MPENTDITKTWMGEMIDDLYEKAFAKGKLVGSAEVINYLAQHRHDYYLSIIDIEGMREVFKV